MKKLLTIIITFCLGFNAIAAENPRNGAYFGEEPPGMTPKLFAKDYISTNAKELNSVFSADGKEFFFTRPVKSGEKLKYEMWVSHQDEDGWSTPAPWANNGPTVDVDMEYSPDGKRLYWVSMRPIDGEMPANVKLYYAEKLGDGWGKAIPLSNNINQHERTLYPAISSNGSLYFSATTEGGMGKGDIYRSDFKDGMFQPAVNLGAPINTTEGEGDIAVAMDESFMVINASGREDGRGGGDLYVSFRQEDGAWSKLKNLGDAINTASLEYCPKISPDGKYFFFTSNKTGDGDVYWVDIQYIKDLK